MARTGTGVQGDPYIVHNWDELVQSIGEVGAYVEFPLDAVLTTDTTVQRGKLYYKLVSGDYVEVTNPKQSELSTYYENSFEIDLNDEYPEGIPPQGSSAPLIGLSVKGYFDGKGGTIRNIYMAADVDSILFLFDRSASFINTDILNIYFVGRGGNESVILSNRFAGNSTDSLMRRCRMSGVIYNSNFYLKNRYVDLKLERCTFAFYGRLGDCGIFSGSGGVSMGAVGFKNCVFDFTCSQMRNFSCYTSSSTNYLYIGASNCLFTGNCTLSGATDIFNRLNSCVFDVILNGGTVPVTYQVNYSEVPSVFNISKANLSFLGTTTHIEATQQQIEDASWLLSQGFPVGRLT